jgi:hypothetical protein
LFLHGAPCHAAADFAIAGSALRRQRANESEERDGGKDDSVDHNATPTSPDLSSWARFKKALTASFWDSLPSPAQKANKSATIGALAGAKKEKFALGLSRS